jgi:glycine cleavage system protein P-like pyridoxal-binding family
MIAIYFLIVHFSGAQGEYAGLRAIRAYHEHQGSPQRRVRAGIRTMYV